MIFMGEVSVGRVIPFVTTGFLLGNIINKFSGNISEQLNNLSGLLINLISVF